MELLKSPFLNDPSALVALAFETEYPGKEYEAILVAQGPARYISSKFFQKQLSTPGRGRLRVSQHARAHAPEFQERRPLVYVRPLL